VSADSVNPGDRWWAVQCQPAMGRRTANGGTAPTATGRRAGKPAAPSRQSTGLPSPLMGALSPGSQRRIAVVTEHSISLWISLLSEPAKDFVSTSHALALLGSAAVDVVNHQELGMRLSATCAFRRTIAIVLNDLDAQPPNARPTTLPSKVSMRMCIGD
jgi:hypothetical protein